MYFNAKQTKWLKCFHLLAVAGWAGGALSLFLLHFLRFRGSVVSEHLHGIDISAHLIDMGVIVALGAMGCLVTGLLYSLCTPWGFVRHRWIIVKWVITAFCILSGLVFLGPWESAMVDISRQSGANPLTDTKYLSSMYLNFWFGLFQFILIVFAMFISVFKPWKTKQIIKSQ